jgi:hypothetical protein
MHKLRIVAVSNPALKRFEGEYFPTVQAEQPDRHECEVFADLVLANGCDIGLATVGLANEDVDGLAELFRDSRTIVGASRAFSSSVSEPNNGTESSILRLVVRVRPRGRSRSGVP